MNIVDTLFLPGFYNRSYPYFVSNEKTTFQKLQQDFESEKSDLPVDNQNSGWLLTIYDDDCRKQLCAVIKNIYCISLICFSSSDES